MHSLCISCLHGVDLGIVVDEEESPETIWEMALQL
jgi:hypothetical protein